MPHIVSINISNGGVPKLPVERVQVTRNGLIGDRQEDTRHHGGPDRAVSIFSLEIIQRLQREGHPVTPGACGENLTISGLDWPAVAPGSRLIFDRGVILEIVTYCSPCKTIRAAFTDEHFGRISQKINPGESRVYARVIAEGQLQQGESVSLSPADSNR